MVKHQMQRSNLSTFEKVRLAYLSQPTIEKMARENFSLAGKSTMKNEEIGKSINIEKIDTHEEIANIAGVGRTTAFRYSQIQAHATPEALKSLYKGDISISSALFISKKKNKQRIPN
jgi:hypothetical protein